MTVAQWFCDESKAKGYLLVAVCVDGSAVASVRRSLRGHLRAGQRAIHFNAEKEISRAAFMKTITASPITARVYRYEGLAKDRAREACVRQVATDAKDAGVQRLVFERDASVVARDNQWLRETLGPRTARSLSFEHLARHGDPMLWAADGIAWCIQRGAGARSMLNGISIVEVLVS